MRSRSTASEVRAVVYARVSTDDQAQHGTSIGTQVGRCREWIAEQGWQLVATYIDDGVTGATLNRPGLASLRAAVRGGGVDRIVVTDPDRLSRDLVDGLVVERELHNAGALVVFLAGPEMSRLERQLRGVIAEEERRKIRDRTVAGRQATIRAGGWPSGSAPFGYRIVREGRAPARLAEDAAEASTIREAVRCLVDERMTTSATAAHLNACGMKPRTVPAWSRQLLRRILLKSGGLSGTWTCLTGEMAGVTISIPAILTPERHEVLRRVLATTSTGPRQRVRSYLLESGRLVSQCGSPMYGSVRPQRRAVYACYRSNQEGVAACGCRQIDADGLDKRVWDEVVALLTSPQRLIALAGIVLDDASAAAQAGADDVKALDRRIRKLERALSDHVADLLRSGMDPQVVTRASAVLSDELSGAKAHRARVIEWASANHSQASRAEQLWALAEQSRDKVFEASPLVRGRIAQLLDLRVRITGHEPCSTCFGKGLVGKPGRGLRPPVSCPECLRFRGRPTIVISGLVPEASSLGSPADVPRHAFNVVAG